MTALRNVRLFTEEGTDLGRRVMHRLKVGDHVHADEGYWKVVSVLDKPRSQTVHVVNASVAKPRKPPEPISPRDTFPKMRARHRREELELLVEALEDTKWKLTKAGRLIDIKRTTIYALIRKHNIKRK